MRNTCTIYLRHRRHLRIHVCSLALCARAPRPSLPRAPCEPPCEKAPLSRRPVWGRTLFAASLHTHKAGEQPSSSLLGGGEESSFWEKSLVCAAKRGVRAQPFESHSKSMHVYM